MLLIILKMSLKNFVRVTVIFTIFITYWLKISEVAHKWHKVIVIPSSCMAALNTYSSSFAVSSGRTLFNNFANVLSKEISYLKKRENIFEGDNFFDFFICVCFS